MATLDRAAVTERLDSLRTQQEEAKAEANAALNALGGAIQDCEFWLAALDAQEKAEREEAEARAKARAKASPARSRRTKKGRSK